MPVTCVRVPSLSPACTRTGSSALVLSRYQSVDIVESRTARVESGVVPAATLRTAERVRFFALVLSPAASAGLKRSAAFGTDSASLAEPVRSFTVAVMPGSNLPSGFPTATTAV